MPEPISILLLEDDDELRERLAEVLDEEGYAVEAVGSGEAAVARAGQKPFDLVLTDIRMHGMDGLEALARVRQEQPDVRSLVITGYSTEADSIRAIQLGVGEYLKKPFRLDAFLDAVNRLATQRRQQMQAQQREQALLRTTRTALERLARMVSESVVGEGRLAARLAEQLAYPARSVEEVGLVTLVAGLRRSDPELVDPGLLEGLPPSTRSLLSQVEGSEEEVGAEAQLAHLVLAEDRSGFPEPLRAALERARQHSPVGDGPRHDPGRHRRGLLSLGRGLEDGGDREQAARAYQDVLKDEVPSREAVEAWLGLARLARAAGDREGAVRALEQAWRLGRLQGPSAQSEAALEVGIQLGLSGSPEAGPMLQTAASLAPEPGRLARARLAAAAMAGATVELETELEAFMQPQNQDDWALSAPWLLPFLLRSGAPEKVLRRLAREAPGELLRLTEEPSVRARAVALLSGGEHEELLRGLLSHPDEAVRQAAQGALQRSGVDLGPPVLRVHSLGPFEAFVGEHRVGDRSWRSLNVRWMLARLMADPGRPVSTEVLMEEFWPEDDEVGRRNVYWAVSVLRKCLMPSGWPGELDWIQRTQQGLCLNPDLPRWHDLEQLEGALGEGTEESLRRALQLYRGPYLEGCYLDWAVAQRHALERRVLEAGLRLSQLWLERQKFAEALECATRVTELDPCCQEAYVARMQANLGLGHPEESLRVFEACRKILRREFGMEPSIDLLREQQRALIMIP